MHFLSTDSISLSEAGSFAKGTSKHNETVRILISEALVARKVCKAVPIAD